jgi:hypothetical protein
MLSKILDLQARQLQIQRDLLQAIDATDPAPASSTAFSNPDTSH